MPRLIDRSKFVVIRLALHGCTNRPFFHIVLARNRSPRNAKPIAQLGTYDPLPNKYNEIMVSLNMDKINDVLRLKPVISKPAAKLLGLSGVLPLHPLSYLDGLRCSKRQQLKSAKNLSIQEDGEEGKEEELCD
ncbi:28S ribosomal protein S16, mitochondrial-like [Mizuhopecten yessoensis]|uniref:Small ribosomal subunit protein bS16m n=1 Tax=Mizuhopecten yessoensis TaxID=6573 RepID=A0A210R2Y4_MIZYE|nr:28S ribosomal protein S16, mitochondrial-like [Mizuhopecten yessoensis]OWF55315.1 28S ribosomal protein S16, mitochondrial [Mizuhopecten yessoensis]